MSPCRQPAGAKRRCDLLDVERPNITRAAIAVGPRFAEALPAEVVFDDAGRNHFHIARHRRIERILVAAHLVMFSVEATRAHLRDGRVDDGATIFLARANLQLDRLRMHLGDVRHQLAALQLSETNERFALGRIRLAVDDDHGLRWRTLLQANRVGGRDDRDDRQAIERYIAGVAFFNAPGHDALLAADVEIRVGEAGSGPDIAGTRFEVRTLSDDIR